jgi:4'-phosphopantetheinyl transferase
MQTFTSLFEQSSGQTGTAAAMARQVWKRGPVAPVIWPNEVHVWRANLELPWSWTFDEALSLDDRARADRFRFESDRRRFCTARASLRLILGRYLKTKPGRLQLDVGKCGKPYFADEKASMGLRFNLSHSNRLALIAITRNREVGVDVEFVRPDFVTNDVAEHFFSRAEAEQFSKMPSELRTQSFFNCWTRKEAYIKARGEGLSCPLDQFDVSFSPKAPPMILDTRIEGDDGERWSLEELHPEPGYTASLAVDGTISRLVLWDFARANLLNTDESRLERLTIAT